MKSEGYFLIRKGDSDKAFELREFTVPDRANDDVLIEVEAFGLNYADVMARKGLYQEAPPMPCIIGYEVIGKLIECGDPQQKDLIGKRVLAFCRFGGYAKHVITKSNAIVPVGDEPAAELLALCTQGVTAYYMSRYVLNIHENENVLVHAAAGGVGTILVQLAKSKGARVIAKVGNDAKKDLVVKLGADHVVNYRQGDYADQVRNVLSGQSLDICFNPVGGSTYKKDVELLGAGGRMVLFGGSELGNGKWGVLSKLIFVKKMGLIIPVALMMKSKNIIGVNMLRIADDKPEVLEKCLKGIVTLYKEGSFKPQVGGFYPATELSLAHAELEGGSTTGKLAVYW